MVMVKVCGITQPPDAEEAFSLGADYLGLIFAPSARQLDEERARRIIETVPTFNQFVGVFQNETLERVLTITAALGIGFVQLHGDESPEYCQKLHEEGISVLKVIAVKERIQEEMLARYPVFAFLFDTFYKGSSGGTGKTFSWSLLETGICKKYRIFLSGGLTPDNVDKAIDTIHPYGVDASSGLEKRLGVKDSVRVREFIRHAKQKVC